MEKLIIDTDIGNDCDDMGALALCHALCKKGEAELLAVTACLSTPCAAGCIHAVNRYYPNVVPIGENFNREEKRLQYDEGGCAYDKIIFERFNKGYKTNREESLSVLRKTLSEAQNNSVTLVGIGYLTNFARLLESKPDEISSLSGKELISKKIKKTVIMAGNFSEKKPEFNIENDIESAKTVFENWQGEVIVSPFEIGNKIRTLKSIYKNTENPVGLSNSVYPWAKEKGRESWDLTAVLYAICEDLELWNLSQYGKISVSDDGVTSFEENKNGKHRYLISKNNEKEIEEIIDSIVK